MIQPVRLNSHIQFKGTQAQEADKPQVEQENIAVQTPEQTVKATPKDAFEATKDLAIGSLKNFNNVANTSQGALRGIAEGAVGAVVIGVLGKNIKNSEGKIASTLTGITKDTGKGVAKAVKSIPSLLTKSPVQNLKSAVSLPKKFLTSYLKGNKITAAAAGAIGLSIAALRTIQGKMNANLHNADIDHKTNRGHIK